MHSAQMHADIQNLLSLYILYILYIQNLLGLYILYVLYIQNLLSLLHIIHIIHTNLLGPALCLCGFEAEHCVLGNQ